MRSSVEVELGVRLTVTPSPSVVSPPPAMPIELGIRHNPKRAHLLVSRLLGKHIPVAVSDVVVAGRALGELVRGACGGKAPIVIGFAETATALGHAVAASARADGAVAGYLHTTRRPQPEGSRVVQFLEEHSHAVDQLLVVGRPTTGGTPLMSSDPDTPMVLVDDELSTGRSAINAIRALQQCRPQRHFVLACLVDSRTPAQRDAVAAEVAALGADVTSVSLYDAAFSAPGDVLDRAATLRARLANPAPAPPLPARPIGEVCFASTTPMTADAGWSQAAEDAARLSAADLARRLAVPGDARTLVLGDEEFMYLPQLIAAALGPAVRVSSTTRSPAVVIDTPGYPLRTGLTFPSTSDPHRLAYAYNVAPSMHADAGNAPGFDHVVFVTDNALGGHVRDGLLAQLSTQARCSVQVVAPC